MKTPQIFSHTKPIIDLIVEDTGLHPDIVRTVLQSQYNILQEEVFLKGHIADLCGLGSVAIYDNGEDPTQAVRRSPRKRYIVKYKASQKVRRVVQQFNSYGTPDGVTYPHHKKTRYPGSLSDKADEYYGSKVKSDEDKE